MSEQETDGRRPRRGRKAKGTPMNERGVGATVNARISIETRRALEAESDRTGRSISQVVDTWLGQIQRNQATVEDMLGGLQVADTVRALIRVAMDLEKEMGDPAVDAYARRALITSWAAIMQNALPFTPPSAEEEQKAHAQEAVRSVLFILRAELSTNRSGPENAAIAAALVGDSRLSEDPTGGALGSLLDKTRLTKLSLLGLTSEAIKADDWTTTAIPKALEVKLATLNAAGHTLPQFAAVLVGLKAYKHASDAHMTRTIEAQQRGKRLANTITARRNEGAEDLKAFWNKNP